MTDTRGSMSDERRILERLLNDTYSDWRSNPSRLTGPEQEARKLLLTAPAAPVSLEELQAACKASWDDGFAHAVQRRFAARAALGVPDEGGLNDGKP